MPIGYEHGIFLWSFSWRYENGIMNMGYFYEAFHDDMTHGDTHHGIFLWPLSWRYEHAGYEHGIFLWSFSNGI